MLSTKELLISPNLDSDIVPASWKHKLSLSCEEKHRIKIGDVSNDISRCFSFFKYTVSKLC